MTIDHPAILETRSLHWISEADCAAFAQTLAQRPGIWQALIELQGPLGAGKTTFVRHLLRALGVTGRVKSPTFTVLEPYRVGERDIAHLDFYRFDEPQEWLDAGLRDVFAQDILRLVEWPEKAGSGLPQPDLRLSLQPQTNEEHRLIHLHAMSPLGQELLK
jgi:tRNA threonylcarbamoyladenosine biosynthesis protein TsaE